jgi:uroporphyrinogen-III synthase
VGALEKMGAEVFTWPAIEIAPPESWGPMDDALRSAASYDWIVVTSTNGVEAVFARLRAIGQDAKALDRCRIAAVGSATAKALGAANRVTDAVPEEFNSEALAKTLEATGVHGRRFLIVRALEGRDVLRDELTKLGGIVDVVVAYRTLKPDVDISPLRARLEAGEISMVTFASPSAVRNYVDMFEAGEALRLHASVAIAVIGSVTEHAAREVGLAVSLRPAEATAAALAEAIRHHFDTDAK